MHLIPIGQFSRMTRLSIKALRLYDDRGLLRPSRVDPSSGYRYYDPIQANRAEAIRILRSVDMPLDEIGRVLDAHDSQDARALLLEHRTRLAERLAAQERMLTYLEALIEREEGVMPYEVAVTEARPQRIAATKVHTNLSRIAEDIRAGFALLMGELGRSEVAPAGPPLLVYHSIIDEETDGEVEICIPVRGEPAAANDVYGRELEGGTVATTTHRGPYEEIAPAYHTLTGWIPANGWEHAGPPREIYLNDPREVAPAELLTRVEFPVVRAGAD